MTKIIHPYQLLEAPQVNILNNNIVEDVNYSYSEVDYGYKEIGSVTQNVYEFPQPITSSSGEVGYVGLDNNYTFVGDETVSYVETIIVSQDISYLIYLFNFPYNGSYDAGDFQVSEHLETGGYIGTVQNKPFLRLIESNSIYSTTSQYSHTEVFSNAEDALQYVRTSGNNYAIFKTIDGFGVYARRLKVWLGMVGETPQYGINNITKDFTITLLNKTVSSTSTQVDTNSNLSIGSNELMQQDTKVNDTTQISEYIADNIKTHYADGKATISMQVVDDGTQEYDVHDIVIPFISTKFQIRHPIVTEITNAIVSDYEDREVSLDGAVYFLTKINNLWVLCSNVLLTNPSTTRTAILTSLDLTNWEVSTLINENSSSISKGFVVNDVLFFQYYTTNVNVLYFSKGLDNINDLQTISFEKSFSVSNITYYNGYYYIAGWDTVNGEYSLVYRISDFELEDGVNAEKIFEVSSFRSAQIQFYKNKAYIAGSDYSVTGHPFMIYVTADFTNYTTEVFANSPSSMAVTQLIASNDAIIWGRYYSLDGENWIDGSFGDVRYQKISTNKYINGYIGSVGDDTKYSLSPTQEWNDLIEDVIGVTYNYEEGIILVTSGTDPVIYIINFYGTNNPLLTNADGTAKEFEITSSELVYDGLTYYNIEAVENT